MGTLDANSLFAKSLLDRAVHIYVNQLFENIVTVEGFTNLELEQLLCLTLKESYFILNSLV